MLLGDVPDQLLDDDGLADAGAAEDPDLAALLERADEVDDLQAGLEHLDLGRLVVEGRRLAVDREHDVGARPAPLPSIAWPSTSNTRPRVASPTGTVIGPPVSTDRGAAREAVRGRHRDGAHPVVAQVLLDLADERLLALADDLNRVVDRRQLAGGELDVHDRAGDLDDAAGRGSGAAVAMWGSVLLRPAQRACAPVAISIISRVMLDWRTLL